MTSNQYYFIRTMSCCIEEIFPSLPSDTILFVACQSALETSFGTSDLCCLHKNYFGMRNPMTRPSTSLVWGNPQFEWSEYHSCTSSIIDYFLCIVYRKPLWSQLDTVEHFSSYIKNWYCPEKDYVDKIMKIYKQFKLFKNEK